MSIITLPTGLCFGQFAMSQQSYNLKEMSDTTGTAKERVLSPPRWRVQIGAPSDFTYEQSALWQTMTLQLRGGLNHLALHDVARPSPAGTLTGAPALNSTLAAGATSMSVKTATANSTLKIGDWLQIGTGLGSQLVAVTADVTFSGTGTGTVLFEPPARKQFAANTVLTWSKPVAYYKLSGTGAAWSYQPGAFLVRGFNLDLLEQWS